MATMNDHPVVRGIGIDRHTGWTNRLCLYDPATDEMLGTIVSFKTDPGDDGTAIRTITMLKGKKYTMRVPYPV